MRIPLSPSSQRSNGCASTPARRTADGMQGRRNASRGMLVLATIVFLILGPPSSLRGLPRGARLASPMAPQRFTATPLAPIYRTHKTKLRQRWPTHASTTNVGAIAARWDCLVGHAGRHATWIARRDHRTAGTRHTIRCWFLRAFATLVANFLGIRQFSMATLEVGTSLNPRKRFGEAAVFHRVGRDRANFFRRSVENSRLRVCRRKLRGRFPL